MYSVDTTKRFDKDLKLCLKRGLDIQLIYDAIALLRTTGSLPAQYRPHKLSGNMDGIWECHLKPDWLLIWEQNDTELTLLFTGTGTHSDLF
jgi:mRNA interferase YafQ